MEFAPPVVAALLCIHLYEMILSAIDLGLLLVCGSHGDAKQLKLACCSFGILCMASLQATRIMCL